MDEAAAIILAGGKSSRMGQDKALMRVRENRMLEEAVIELSGIFKYILISANDVDYSWLNVKVVPDIFKGCGPLGGIHAGLTASNCHTNFLFACDMPFLNTSLALYMVDAGKGFDVVMPRLGKYLQPLFAVYTKACLPVVDEQLRNGHYKVASFFERVRTRYVDPGEIACFGDPELLFFNVNTPADLERAKEMAGRKKYGPQD